MTAHWLCYAQVACGTGSRDVSMSMVWHFGMCRLKLCGRWWATRVQVPAGVLPDEWCMDVWMDV